MTIIINYSRDWLGIRKKIRLVLVLINIIIHYVVKFFNLFIFSLLFHTIFLFLTKLGLFGQKLKKKIIQILTYNPISLYVLYFFVILLIIFYINYNVIYCDSDNITFTTVIQNLEITLSGGVLNDVFRTLGNVGVFTAGARISAAIVSKQKMGTLPKVGIIGSTAAGFTMVFQIINTQFTGNSSLIPSSITVNLSQVKPTIPNTSPEAWNNLISSFFGGIKIEGKIPLLNNTIRGNPEQISKVIEQLDLMNPNWRDLFINSPLELGDHSNSLVSFLFTSLSNSLYLHYINLYLIIMLIIIFTCKYIIDRNINLLPIKKIFGGKYLYLGLTKYLSFWRNSVNFWLYYIMFSLLIFNLASCYSIYQAITALNSIN